ncbi:hypothetical protein OB919_13270 [Halobacteria archaeon AArc-curdl1]|uniref:Cohesin domain-containing protein n=2 Tax=Natronosalvus hydrolyticus TaxID=2979988 RepID=A0AAP3E7H0_9EURY|nr:hypothetical protein [Halobacteria archaeon AArc-curdl1]
MGGYSTGKRDRSIPLERMGIALVVLALCLAGIAIIFGAGIVSAGDQLAVIAPADNEIDAEPGEEFEVDVLMRSRGGHGGTGVAEFTLVAQYHPDYLEITSVEGANWLEQGTETDVVEEHLLAHEAGTVILEQRRDPVDGGATGDARVATLTVRVAEDAPPSEASIDFGDSSVILENDLPLAILDQAVTVSIDDGEEPVDSFDHPDPEDRETLEAAVTAADESGGEDGEDDEGVAEPIPGFRAADALIAVGFVGVIGFGLLAVGRWRRT